MSASCGATSGSSEGSWSSRAKRASVAAERTRLTVERQLRTPLMEDLAGNMSGSFGRKEGAEWCERVSRAQSQAFLSLRRRIRNLRRWY